MSNNRTNQWMAASMGMVTLATVATGAESLRVEAATRSIPERGLVAVARVLDEGRKATFIVPSGWRIGASPTDKKVVLQTEDYGATCVIRFHNGAKFHAGEEAAAAEELRELALAEDTHSRVLKEYIWPTSQGQAFVFEMETKIENGLKSRSRVLYLVRGNRMFEFRLTAKDDQFATFQKVFENLIASFREE